MELSDFRVSKHCFLVGKNTVQAKKCIDKCYLDSAPSIQMVEKWIADFKSGRTNTDDAERPGRQNLSVVPENIRKSTKWFGPIVN